MITKTTIRVQGQGGDGVKFMLIMLAKILSQKHNVTLVFSYDSAVRGGNVVGDLVVSPTKIVSPVVTESDLLVDMAKSTVVWQGEGIVKNMFYLGYILKLLDYSSSTLDFDFVETLLDSKNVEDNLKSIKKGLNSN